MQKITRHDDYHKIEYRTELGITTALLTDHEYNRIQDRAKKHGLVPRKPGLWARLKHAILYILLF